jgi:hypothetical protein
MELYKYTGSVAALTVRFGKAETITLYDSYDDSVAPVRLDVRGALAEHIKKIEGTDSEERYMNLDWYYDFNMLLRRIEVPGVPSEKFQMAAGDGRNAQKGVAGAKPQRSVNYENEVLQGNFLPPQSPVQEWRLRHRA